ncbi:hypothetical protein Goklo_008265, partial [Gossypium klotzschianum]|nr:hypothetical protein [Gossypium klotzschianum]
GAKTFGKDFQIHNLILPWSPNPHKWEKPPIGFIKINMDAVVCNNKYGFRVIIHDCDGFVCGGCAGYKGDLPSTDIVNHLRKYHIDITIFGHFIVEIRGMIDLFAEAE